MVKILRFVGLTVILLIVLSLSAVLMPAGVAYAANLHVGSGQPFSSIQDAVYAASPGDTIIVHPGTYNENVSVNTERLTIRSFSGNPSNTIVDGDGNDNVFNVTVDYVTISGFTITGGEHWGNGVHLWFADYCEISHNIITGNATGISLGYSYHNTITDNFISDNWYSYVSCPFVYSWDGQEYRLDADVFSGAMVKAFERADYDNLDYLTLVAGKYQLKLAEELNETGYINELKLTVVDHPVGTQIIADPSGNIHTLRAPYAPIAGEEEDGTDCLAKVTGTDGTCWTSNLDNKDFSQQEDLTDGIILTFDKPAGASIAKVALNYKFSLLSEYPMAIISKLTGEKLADWYQALNSNPSEAAKWRAFGQRLLRLYLLVWDGSKWVGQGIFSPPGPWIARDVIKTIDVSGIAGDTIKIKLLSTTGLALIDWVGMDYSADEPVIATELSAMTAVDANGIDVAPEILATDDDYLVLEQGDYAYLSFDELAANPGYDRSYVVKAEGYYQPSMAAAGEAQDELVEKLLTDYPYAARYFLEGYASRSGHCGIYLGNSDDNIISDNEIAGNFPEDGIDLYWSNRNQITDNDIHNNQHGIYLQFSNDNEIILNDIRDNPGIDSGIHVEFGCSGNVAHCNNIEGNGPPYGVYNHPTNPKLNAENNWWGHKSGPGGVGPGSGDAVSDNVDYAPWLVKPSPSGPCLEAAPPVAAFSATPMMGEAPLAVKFHDESKGEIDTWGWDFGASGSSNQNPTFTYYNEGIYKVCLTVSGPGGEDSICKTIIVDSPATAPRLEVRDLKITPVYAQPRQEIAITAEVMNTGGSWGSETVNLMINGQYEQSAAVGVAPGTAQPIKFTVYKINAGKYEVNVGGATGTLYVLEQPVTPTVTPPATAATGGLLVGGELDTTGIIAIVAIGVILIGGIIAVVVLGRRPR